MDSTVEAKILDFCLSTVGLIHFGILLELLIENFTPLREHREAPHHATVHFNFWYVGRK